jgi:4-hydroxybenzoate polyprenyltransferase
MTGLIEGLKEAFIPAILIVVVPTAVLGFLLSGSDNLALLAEAVILIVLADVSANVINNYADWHIDVFNEKRNAMHSVFERQHLLFMYGALLLVLYSVMLIIGANLYLISSVTIFVILGMLYSVGTKLKDRVFLNYLTIAIAYAAVSASVGFFSGNGNVSAFLRWSPLLLFLVFVDLGYSMTKDYSDIVGDRKHNKKTFPVMFGKGKTVKIQLAFITLAYAFLVAAVLEGLLNPLFLILLVSYAFAIYIVIMVHVTEDKDVHERMHFNSQRNGLLVRLIIIVILLAVYFNL